MLSASQMRQCTSRCSRPSARAVHAVANVAGQWRVGASPLLPPTSLLHQQQHRQRLPCASPADDVQPVPPAPLSTQDDPDSLRCDADWIASMVQLWLDEEWCPQEVHAQLGRAAGDAYARIRAGGEDEMGGLLLSLSNELMSFNYRECFVGPFDVSNKVVEMLMQRDGTEVCCTSPDDATRAARLAQQQNEA